MFKSLKSVRLLLGIGLFLSVIFAAYSIYYKIEYWGFSFKPRQTIPVWTLETHLNFIPNGKPVKITMSRPAELGGFKVLDEEVVARGYEVEKGEHKVEIKGKPKRKEQDIYYRILLYDNVDTKGKIRGEKAPDIEKPVFDEQTLATLDQLLETSKTFEGDLPQKLVALFNQMPPDQTVQAFLPLRKSLQDNAEAIVAILNHSGFPARVIKGVKLVEGKKALSPDVMIEVYLHKTWKIYNVEDGSRGIPSNFIVLKRGGQSIVDLVGGENSVIKFSVMKSLRSSFGMAGHRAKLSKSLFGFDYSIYNLPVNQQNAIKWLMIFPLAILVVVLMRNVVGIATMGTFTPMLISLALVQTGFGVGLICFTLIVAVGMLIRTMLSKLNLLLVPRISAVVIFVILIIQALAIIGYQMQWTVASSALFFPIIIMAWIIERASITWEEEGAKNATREVFFSVVVAIITYFVIMNEYIRHIFFAFNELNIIILFVVMLLGTYTGYRLTELARFAPLVRGKK